jgi:hypothetical protein
MPRQLRYAGRRMAQPAGCFMRREDDRREIRILEPALALARLPQTAPYPASCAAHGRLR